MRLSTLRRLLVGLIGATVVLIGIALLVLPGPAIVVIPAGLAILASEFAWARHVLHRVRKRMGLSSDEPPPGAPEAGATEQSQRRDAP